MYIPTWAIVTAVVLLGLHLIVDVWRFVKCRHHDHLLPNTPRRPRG